MNLSCHWGLRHNLCHSLKHHLSGSFAFISSCSYLSLRKIWLWEKKLAELDFFLEVLLDLIMGLGVFWGNLGRKRFLPMRKFMLIPVSLILHILDLFFYSFFSVVILSICNSPDDSIIAGSLAGLSILALSDPN